MNKPPYTLGPGKVRVLFWNLDGTTEHRELSHDGAAMAEWVVADGPSHPRRRFRRERVAHTHRKDTLLIFIELP